MDKVAEIFLNPAGPKQHAIADLLLSIAPSTRFLVKHSEKKRYITLDEQTGKSKNNKNAVTVPKRGVSFMVSDWSLEARVNDFGLKVKREDNKKLGRRLMFLGLTTENIHDQQPYFVELLVQAKRESQSRQSLRASKKRVQAKSKDEF